MTIRWTLIASCAALAMAVCGGAHAEDHVVRAVVTNWQPLVVFAQPGDRIIWTNMTGHDTESIEGMIPEGAESWQSKLGEQFTVTVEKEGAYIYKCNPHMATGMVGAIVVGDGNPGNLESIEASLPEVKIGRNMVARAIRKMKKALDERGGS